MFVADRGFPFRVQNKKPDFWSPTKSLRRAAITWVQIHLTPAVRNQNVRAWVKNDHIGFEITYSFKGVIHKFRPDYLVSADQRQKADPGGEGQGGQQNQTKREFLSEWVRAVNGHGGFGEWTVDVSRHPKDVLEILERHNNERSS